MNRGLFGTIVMLGIILLVTFMASCESKSGRMANMPKPTTVKIVLIRQTNAVMTVKQFRVHKVGDKDSTIYFWSTTLPYEAKDIVEVPVTTLQR